MTAFNGTQPAGLPTILLHSQSSAGPSLTLKGTLKSSDVGGFGKMLDVPVDLGPFQGTEAITDFKVVIGKVLLPSKGKSAAAAKKKKKKPRSTTSWPNAEEDLEFPGGFHLQHGCADDRDGIGRLQAEEEEEEEVRLLL